MVNIMDKVMYISLGANEFTYNRDICMYQLKRYIHGIKPTDNIQFYTSEYTYYMSIVPLVNGILISIPLKPKINIQLKLIVSRRQ